MTSENIFIGKITKAEFKNASPVFGLRLEVVAMNRDDLSFEEPMGGHMEFNIWIAENCKTTNEQDIVKCFCKIASIMDLFEVSTLDDLVGRTVMLLANEHYTPINIKPFLEDIACAEV